MTDPAADPFPADALELNRAGKLTDQQRARFTRLARSWRRNELTGAGVLAVIGVVLLVAGGPSSSTLGRLGPASRRAGTDEAGDAWIVGETLTIIDGEMALQGQRVAAG